MVHLKRADWTSREFHTNHAAETQTCAGSPARRGARLHTKAQGCVPCRGQGWVAAGAKWAWELGGHSSCRGSRELFVQEVWALLPACPEPSLPAPHTSPLPAPLEPSQKDVFPGTC
ncbi:unnamed protein product [Rangifer tarandus platyrhynchus]|uniref:Uncharacterized protein n=1 Tax=Rangifer tarandus platyrhynchus TaxID=3082113 RepID=A0ABN8ZM82_RANTA|nr:unnamed protein product [Rangifer tarandus platyrhynchus]